MLCIVPGCSEEGEHNFPRDHNRWLKWRKAIIRAKYPKVSNSWHPRYSDLICSKHFKPEDLIESTSTERRGLTRSAVPSVFKDSTQPKVKIANVNKDKVNTETNMAAANSTAISVPKKEEIVHRVAKGSSRRVTIFQGENHAPNMCKALNDLRVRGVCCDVSIIVPNTVYKDSEGIKFKAHSVVLAARSAFFKTFFMKPENCTHQNIVMPSYINGRAVEIVLHYMYTGKLGIRKDTVSTIFQVGWLFQMDDILMLCKQFCKMKKFTPSPIEVNATNYTKSTSDNNENDKINANNNEETMETDNNLETDVLPSITKDDIHEVILETTKTDEIKPEITTEETKINDDHTQTDVNEISVVMKDEKDNNELLVEGPPEMIECTPTILAENEDDEDYTPNSQQLQEKKERKLIIFKTGPSQTLQTKDGSSRLSNENGFGNADLIVVHFRPNLYYTSPVLYVVHGMKNYSDLLIHHGFFHIEFHVDNNCRKGVVKTDGSLICVMFGQVNHFFPIFHTITTEDMETYRYDEHKPLTFSTKRIVPIKRPSEITDEWDPIFGRDKDCEKDVLHCFSCSCVFFTIQGKASHLLRHHRSILHWDTDLNVYKYPCGACEFMCTNLRLLYFHRHQKHDWLLPEVVLQFRCGLCCACETSIHTARDHMIKLHNLSQMTSNLVPPATGKKVFLHLVTKDGLKKQLVAPDPEIVSIGNELLRQSQNEAVEKKNEKEKLFKCPQCVYISAYNSNLKNHIRNKHTLPGAIQQKKKRKKRRKNVY